MLIELLSLGVTAESHERKEIENRRFRSTRSRWAKLSGRRGRSPPI